MAVPTSIADLDIVAINNSPQGSDSIGTSLDDYLRSHAAILKKLSNDIQAAGLAILDDADAAAQRATLGLSIGTNVQAYNSDIPTVAASQVEMEAGTGASLRSMSPLRVKQAIAANSDLSTLDRVTAAQFANPRPPFIE